VAGDRKTAAAATLEANCLTTTNAVEAAQELCLSLVFCNQGQGALLLRHDLGYYTVEAAAPQGLQRPQDVHCWGAEACVC
jgi:hypothetical protein